MNEKDLKNLLISGETETIEFKEKANASFFESISAFANAKGGTLLLGVDDKGKIKGVDSSSKFLGDLTNRVVNKLAIPSELETINMKGKRVLVVRVPRSSLPISYEGRYYERIGNTTREMKSENLRALLLRGKSWDSLTGDFSIEEINPETV
jgi:ATP-dependent DNA helicase RecG